MSVPVSRGGWGGTRGRKVTPGTFRLRLWAEAPVLKAFRHVRGAQRRGGTTGWITPHRFLIWSATLNQVEGTRPGLGAPVRRQHVGCCAENNYERSPWPAWPASLRSRRHIIAPITLFECARTSR